MTPAAGVLGSRVADTGHHKPIESLTFEGDGKRLHDGGLARLGDCDLISGAIS